VGELFVIKKILTRPFHPIFLRQCCVDSVLKLVFSFAQSLFKAQLMTSNPNSHVLTLADANSIIDGALAASKKAGFKPMGVVVLDAHGHLRAAQREDGASMFRIDVATGKAWGAVAMGASSRTLAERAKDNPNFFVTLASTAQGKFLPQTGAVLIKDATGEILGAVGASGGTGDEDEEICIAGVLAAGFKN
jgi:uncharacterized protein GlcG (DUF336 family)